MITIKDNFGIRMMSTAGKLLAEMFESLKPVVCSGITTFEIDSWIDNYLVTNNLTSSSKGYFGYKHASCISLNDEIVHGVPNKTKKIKDGDLVKIDVCASYKGYCADMARCFFINEPLKKVNDLVETAKSALNSGIDKARVGYRLTDISFAIETEVNKHGYGIVREFAGHGIGKKMHEDPEILNYGPPGRGPIIKAGMAFAIEPMITLGKHEVIIDADGWTARTADGSIAAHVEDTVIVTNEGPMIITRI